MGDRAGGGREDGRFRLGRVTAMEEVLSDAAIAAAVEPLFDDPGLLAEIETEVVRAIEADKELIAEIQRLQQEQEQLESGGGVSGGGGY